MGQLVSDIHNMCPKWHFNSLHQNYLMTEMLIHTGGGAHKYANEWETELGIQMAKQNEMDSLVAGMQFVMTDIVGECYTFKPNDWSPRSSVSKDQNENVVNGSLKKTPPRVPVDEVSFLESTTSSDTLNESNGESEVSVEKEPLLRGASSSSETNRPRVDQWWTSKKVQRDNVLASN